jgi:putative flippase GtrA
MNDRAPSNSRDDQNLIKEWIRKLRLRSTRLFKIGTFGVSSGIGFLVAEIILTLGVLLIFGSIHLKTTASLYTSPALLVLDVFSLCVGVTVSFFINQTSFKWAELIDSSLAFYTRLLKFQLVSWGGNALIIGVQLLLLREFSIAPTIGNIVGAMIAFPLAYLLSMRYVWKNFDGKILKKKNIEGRSPGKSIQLLLLGD